MQYNNKHYRTITPLLFYLIQLFSLIKIDKTLVNRCIYCVFKFYKTNITAGKSKSIYFSTVELIIVEF